MSNDIKTDDTVEQADTKAPPVERLVMCRWWEAHKYGKWEMFSEEKTIGGRPVLIQQRECCVCGKIKRREEPV